MPESKRIPSDDELRAARRQLEYVAFVVNTIAQRFVWHARVELLSHDTDHQVVKANLIDRAAGGDNAS